MKVFITTLFLTILVIYPSQSQSKQNLEEINYTWSKFYKAFETLDYTLMAKIHSKNLLRISGGRRILDYETYIGNYKNQFAAMKQTKQSNVISLRFFERINNDSIASERGIYKLTRNPNSKNAQSYYGQFHVIMKKIEGQWLIAMDYDSSEGDTIDVKDFEKAFAIDDLKKFSN